MLAHVHGNICMYVCIRPACIEPKKRRIHFMQKMSSSRKNVRAHTHTRTQVHHMPSEFSLTSFLLSHLLTHLPNCADDGAITYALQDTYIVCIYIDVQHALWLECMWTLLLHCPQNSTHFLPPQYVDRSNCFYLASNVLS